MRSKDDFKLLDLCGGRNEWTFSDMWKIERGVN